MEVKDHTRWAFKEALRQRNISQAYLGKAIGRSYAWVSRLSRGWINPTDNDTERIASVLSVDKEHARIWFAKS